MLATLRGKVAGRDHRRGQGRIGGYPATVLSRLTWDCKLRAGRGAAGAVMRKELSLSGVQGLFTVGSWGPDAVEVFRFGDFAGWLIEA